MTRNTRKTQPVPFSDGTTHRVTVDTSGHEWRPDGTRRHVERGHRWVRGCMQFVERIDWSEWADRGAPTARIRRPPQQMLPDMDAEALAAWLAFARRYPELSTSRLAGIMPGWDDVQTFEPTRIPNDRRSGPLWPNDHPRRWSPPGQRARALAAFLIRCLNTATPDT